jgi:hypothetical protein
VEPLIFAAMVESYWPGYGDEPEGCGNGWKPEITEAWNELSDTDKNVVRQAYRAVDDKWGPAGCIDLGDGRFAFLGWASS